MLQRLRDARRRVVGARCAAAAVSHIGRRHAAEGVPNQDTYFSCWAVPDVFVAAVFDGHGDAGGTAARLAAGAMRAALEARLRGSARAGVPLEASVKGAFKETASAVANDACARESGTTATVVVVRGDACVIGHVGDSGAAVLSRKAPLAKKLEARFATVPHRPGASPSEDARVSAAGGILTEGYVVDQVTRDK
eukprot:IDg14823t1